MNVLLAVDGSAATTKAVDFLCRVVGGEGTEHTVTLYHVVESLPDDFLSRVESTETPDEYEQVKKDWAASRTAVGEKLLDDVKRSLTDAGFPDAAVENKLVARPSRPGGGKVAAAIALIEEMKTGGYDVVCLGRRGSSGADGSFLGSVAEKVLREARGLTVWVVD